MTFPSLSSKRKWVQTQINRDPFTCKIYQRGATPDDAQTTFSFTATVQPAGLQGAISRNDPANFQGEEDAALYRSVLLAPWDTPTIKKDDLLVSTHDETGIVRRFTIVLPRHLGHKWECLMDERF